jgi:polysaccharide biosynthesis protein PslH
MRILFLSDWFPIPIDNGSKLRIYNLLRGLAQKHEVTLLSLSEKDDSDPDHPAIRSICKNVRVVRKKPFDAGYRRDLFGWISPTPRSFRSTFSPEMAQWIERTISSDKYDLAIASQIGAASYRRFFQNLPAIFEEVEIGTFYENFLYARTTRSKLRNSLTWIKHRNYTANLLKEFDICTVVSEKERDLVSQKIPEMKRIEVIPNFINLDDYSDIQISPQPKTLIFTGSFRYLPNYEAIVWFLEKVNTLIKVHFPEVKLTITGDHRDFHLPNSSNVIRTGFVKDFKSLLASSWISIVPLQTGGGTRLKILEALALGVPVVSTSKGAEGLEVVEGQHLLIGDTPETFSENILLLFRDPELRKSLAEQGRQLIREKYDRSVVFNQFDRLVEGFQRS